MDINVLFRDGSVTVCTMNDTKLDGNVANEPKFLDFVCKEPKGISRSLVAHRFWCVKFWILNICSDFFNYACLKKTITNIKNSLEPKSIHVSKLLGGVSLVEQDTIENVSVAYFKLISKFKDFFLVFSPLFYATF